VTTAKKNFNRKGSIKDIALNVLRKQDKKKLNLDAKQKDNEE
jgi:hypothetical protein